MKCTDTASKQTDTQTADHGNQMSSTHTCGKTYYLSNRKDSSCNERHAIKPTWWKVSQQGEFSEQKTSFRQQDNSYLWESNSYISGQEDLFISNLVECASVVTNLMCKMGHEFLARGLFRRPVEV